MRLELLLNTEQVIPTISKAKSKNTKNGKERKKSKEYEKKKKNIRYKIHLL